MSLRAYLDAGKPVADVPHLWLLAEAIVLDRRAMSGECIEDAARRCRRLALDLSRDPRSQDLAMVLLWTAEAYADEGLARRFEKVLPPDLLEQLVAMATLDRHPHRLLVSPRETFCCSACGEQYSSTKALVVDELDGLMYCPHCISIAAAAMADPDQVGGQPPEVAATPPRRAVRGGRRRRHRLFPVAAAMTAFTGLGASAGLASAGMLPPTLQRIAKTTLSHVGVEVPEPSVPRPRLRTPASGAPAADRVRAVRSDERPGPNPHSTGAGRRLGPEERPSHGRPTVPGGAVDEKPSTTTRAPVGKRPDHTPVERGRSGSRNATVDSVESGAEGTSPPAPGTVAPSVVSQAPSETPTAAPASPPSPPVPPAPPTPSTDDTPSVDGRTGGTVPPPDPPAPPVQTADPGPASVQRPPLEDDAIPLDSAVEKLGPGTTS